MIGYYNYTVILTYLGMISGFIGITYIGMGELKSAVICLMISGGCDMFDGKIASTMERTKQEKRFGVQIDSLSDLICFGVLPALIIFNITEGTAFKYIAATSFLLCALIRLAWFNVNEEERQDRETETRKFYLGLPVTTCALLLPLLISVFKIANIASDRLLSGLFVLCGVAFILPFRIRKTGTLGNCVIVIVGGFILAAIIYGV